MILSGRARLAGVAGWPVGHSLSPRLHGFWLDRHGIDGAYLPLAVAPERFESALRGLADLGFRGINLTIPHKQAALALCDDVAPLAARIGAVNTLVFEDGRIKGSNTDAFGFLENLRQGAPGWDPMAGPALILGAGGAARAVAVALLDAGAAELRLANRTDARAEALAQELGAQELGAQELGAQALGGRVTAVPWPARGAALDDLALLVNTTSLGMTGQPPLELDLDLLPSDAVVTDIVYAPLETELLARARARGNPVVDGLGMLLHQARPGFEAWFGVAPEVTAELRAFVLAE
jgi:shikimate dehydrogenase